MTKEIRRRIIMGVVSGVSAASFGMTFAAASHEADSRDPHYKTTMGIMRQLGGSALPEARRVIQPQLDKASALLHSERTGYQADQPLTTALDHEIRAISSLTEGQWAQVRKARQEIAAGQAAENAGNALGIAAGFSLLSAAGTGFAAGGAFSRRRS